MAKPRKNFVDVLDVWLESAGADEVHGAALMIQQAAKWRHLGFRVEIKPVKEAALPLLDDEQPSRVSVREAQR